MKGKAKIILTDVRTGEQTVREEENLITNALEKVTGINMACNLAPNTNILPFATNALGGIMLFDGALTESADNIGFPAEAHLVGYAGQSMNTGDVLRGSYNAGESGKTATGYVSVWDFGTNQANGTIRSLARTSDHGGDCPAYWYNGPTYYTTSNGAPGTDNNWYPVRYESPYLYMVKGDSSAHVMRLARVKIPMFRFGAGDWSNVERSLEEVGSWSTLVAEYNSYSNPEHTQGEAHRTVYADSPQMYEDGGDGYLYCVFYAPQQTYHDYGDYDITWFRVKLDGCVKSQPEKRNTGTGYYSNYYVVNVMYYAGRYYGHVHNGVLSRISEDRKSVSFIDLAAGTVSREVQIVENGNADYLVDLENVRAASGVVYFELYHYLAQGFDRRYGLVYADGTVVLPNVAYGNQTTGHGGDTAYGYAGMTCGDDLTVWGRVDSDRVTRNWAANYLGSISNLAAPVTKTSAQTMKIIYTLTDEA